MKIIITFLFLINVSVAFSQTWEVFDTTNSELHSNNTTGIVVDNSGTIWVGTDSGLASYNTNWNQSKPGHLLFSNILDVWYKNGLIWLGTETQGLWSFDGQDSWVDHQPNIFGNGIVGFGIDNYDTTWVLEKSGDLKKLVENQWVDKISSIANPTALFVDKAGIKWVLSGDQGLISYESGFEKIYNETDDNTSPNYIPDASLFCMLEDSKGNYWIGSDNKGLIKFDGNSFTYFNRTNSEICSNRIRALNIDKNDILWIGSLDEGFSRFDGVNWKSYNIINAPLQSNSIHSIEIGIDGKIWLSNGFDEISPEEGKGVIVYDENEDVSEGILPNAPDDLVLQEVSINEVILEWTDYSNNESGFLLERSANNSNNFQVIKFINKNTSKYIDYSVEEGIEYQYRISTVNSVGVSGYSNIESITPKYCKVNDLDRYCYANVSEIEFGDIDNKVLNSQNGYYNYLNMSTDLRPGQTIVMTIKFDKYISYNNDDTVGGEVYIDWNGDGDFDDENELIFKKLNIITTIKLFINVPEDAVIGKTRLRTRTEDNAINGIGSCGYAEETQDYTLNILPPISLATPTDVSVYGTSSKSIILSWTDNSLSESGHQILRSSDGINFDKTIFLEEANLIEFIDNNLDSNKEYYYKIAAISNSEISEYSDIVSAKTLSIDFERVYEGDLVNYEGYHTIGAYWGDFNNDDQLDVYISGVYSYIIYENQNSILNFSMIEFESARSSANSTSWVDYNNDGFLDINSVGLNSILLFKNMGDGNIVPDGSFESDEFAYNCIWFDHNLDGFLDLLVSYRILNYSKLYLNNKESKFTESIKIDETSGFVSSVDYDNDGDLDLYYASVVAGENILLENKGGEFIKNKTSLISNLNKQSYGSSWGDIDNDGDLDLFLANGGLVDDRNSIFLNVGNGDFEEITNGDIVNDEGESFGSSFSDLDNDGNLDLVVTNIEGRNFLYQGNGDGSFEKIDRSIITNEAQYGNKSYSVGCATGDYDNDGFLDLLIANGIDQKSFLFKNKGNSNNWIKIKLSGYLSNKMGIGSKINVWANNKLRYRELSTQTGYAAQNELDLTIGLGKSSMVDSLIIIWPNGSVQKMVDIEVNQTILIDEHFLTNIQNIEVNNRINIYPNPISEYLIIENNVGGLSKIDFIDLSGRIIKSLDSEKDFIKIDTSTLMKGAYLLRVVTNNRSVSELIIKK